MRREIERVETVSGPLIVGRHYLVPTVEGTWYGERRAWPVIGPLHADVEFFNFEKDHYHLDRRFLTAKLLRRYSWFRGGVERSSAEAAPLHAHRGEPPLPAPVWRSLRCNRSEIGFSFTDQPAVQALQAAFAGQSCKRGRAGLICPHRQAPLGSVPVIHGVVTCPLHGLMIDATSGRVIDTKTGSGA